MLCIPRLAGSGMVDFTFLARRRTCLYPECLVDDGDSGAKLLQVSGRCGATPLWHDVSKPYLM